MIPNKDHVQSKQLSPKTPSTYRMLSCGILIALCSLLPSIVVHANSSWHWISETRPYDVLPWVAALTLLIETLAINFIPRVNKLSKTFYFVTLANLLSFAAPYVLPYILTITEGFPYEHHLEHSPSYIVGSSYALLTIAVELPVVYHKLKYDVADKKRLLLVIIASNIVTTIMVYIVERIFCTGSW